MAQKGLSVGDVVEITFLDHAEDSEDALEFVVWGKVLKITKRAYIIQSWAYVDDIERAKDDNPENENHYTIVKTAVTKKRRLVTRS